MSLELVKARMENALASRKLAEKQWDDAELVMRTRLDNLVAQLKAKFNPRKHAVDDVSYRIETFNNGEATIVGVRLTLHRTQQMQQKYYATSLLTIRDLDSIFAEQGMKNWSCENFEDNARVTEIIYL